MEDYEEAVWKREDISKEELFKPVSYKGEELTLSEYMFVKYCEDKIEKAKKLKADQEVERNLLLRSVSLVTALSATTTKSVSENTESRTRAAAPAAKVVADHSSKVVPTKKDGSSLTDAPDKQRDITIEEIKQEQPELKYQKAIKRKREEEDEEFIPLSAVESVEGYGLSVKYDKEWHSTRESSPLIVTLNDFGLSDNNCNVVVIRLLIPSESSRWSINICPPSHHNQQNILLHFNPRYKKRSELILNDKVGTWGAVDKSFRDGHHALRQGQLETLVIIIRSEGFYVFNDNKILIAAFAHRRRITQFSELLLSIPIFDDNGNSEDLIIKKVFWGKNSFAGDYTVPRNISDSIESRYNDINTEGFDEVAARSIFVRGLPAHKDGNEIMELETAIYGLFEAYSPEAVNIVMGEGVAYLRFSSAEVVEDAIVAKNNITMGSSEEDKFTLRLSKLADALS